MIHAKKEKKKKKGNGEQNSSVEVGPKLIQSNAGANTYSYDDKMIMTRCRLHKFVPTIKIDNYSL